jgi:site-specific recombinase XerD
MTTSTLGALVQEFFLSHLVEQKGLRQSSVRSYRDTLRLFLQFAAADAHRQVSKLTPDDLSFERVLAFLRHLEQQRRNGITTRNQRLGALHTFFEFVARRDPDRLRECQQIAAIPVKRSAQPTMHSLTREEVQALFVGLSGDGPLAMRDRALLLFFYNTGARVQEVADLRVEQLALDRPANVRLHGKGDKWRHCPLWNETASILRRLIETYSVRDSQGHVFRAQRESRSRVSASTSACVDSPPTSPFATPRRAMFTSRRMCFGEPLPCIYWRQVSTSTSFVDGSATRTLQQRTATPRLPFV